MFVSRQQSLAVRVWKWARASGPTSAVDKWLLLLLYCLKGTPIVLLSDSEEEEMIILEPDKNPKKIR